MLKKPLAVVVILSLGLLATPAMATAGTWTNAPRFEAPTLMNLFDAWTAFWGSLLGAEAPASASVPEKNGCGIDPNGNPLCGGWTGAATNEDPLGEGSGSGN